MLRPPLRDDNDFDLFKWAKCCNDIPAGCSGFREGSLLDGTLPDGWKSLGWAFAIVDQAVDLATSAHGVSPR